MFPLSFPVLVFLKEVTVRELLFSDKLLILIPLIDFLGMLNCI